MLDFNHNRPDYIGINGIGGGAGLEGFLYDGPAGLPITLE
jgi:hypothetical protein